MICDLCFGVEPMFGTAAVSLHLTLTNVISAHNPKTLVPSVKKFQISECLSIIHIIIAGILCIMYNMGDLHHCGSQ